MNENTSLQLVYAAIDELNSQATNGSVLEKTPEAFLLGGKRGHGIDSLTFVSLIVAIEEQIQKKLQKSVVLVDEDTMSLQEHPFRTVGSLANYVHAVISRQ